MSGTFSLSSVIRLRFTDVDGGVLGDIAVDMSSRCSSLGAVIKLPMLGALWRLVVWSNVAGAGAAWHAQSREFFIEVRARSRSRYHADNLNLLATWSARGSAGSWTPEAVTLNFKNSTIH